MESSFGYDHLHLQFTIHYNNMTPISNETMIAVILYILS